MTSHCWFLSYFVPLQIYISMIISLLNCWFLWGFPLQYFLYNSSYRKKIISHRIIDNFLWVIKSKLNKYSSMALKPINIRWIRTVLSHTENSCTASYYRQFSTNTKIKIEKSIQVYYKFPLIAWVQQSWK